MRKFWQAGALIALAVCGAALRLPPHSLTVVQLVQ